LQDTFNSAFRLWIGAVEMSDDDRTTPLGLFNYARLVDEASSRGLTLVAEDKGHCRDPDRERVDKTGRLY
jgi:hypothetical protein